ncbi:MAG TPA: hypothetical protein VNS46_06790 [Nocardioides sp.]|nr:hypothetical protein [Nocardioides sp.]
MMFIEFSTTITHRVEIGDDGIEGASHSVEIDAGDAASVLPTQVLTIVATAGCRAALDALETSKPTVAIEQDED